MHLKKKKESLSKDNKDDLKVNKLFFFHTHCLFTVLEVGIVILNVCKYGVR